MAATGAIVALTAAQSIAGFGASRTQARAVQQQGEYESKVYGINADLAEQQAEDAIARGHEASLRVRSEARGVAGSQRLLYASAGVDPNVGSARATTAETEAMSELDRITIENNAAREAYGYHVQAADYRTRGMLALASAKHQAASLRMQGYSTLLGGAAEIAHIYHKTK